jgi:hypothetical protein
MITGYAPEPESGCFQGFAVSINSPRRPFLFFPPVPPLPDPQLVTWTLAEDGEVSLPASVACVSPNAGPSLSAAATRQTVPERAPLGDELA